MNDDSFIDAESQSFTYSAKSVVSFQQIVLLHIKRITELACKEFRSSYKNIVLTQLGNGLVHKHEQYVADSRKEFCQSVDCLYDLLSSFFDKEMKQADQQLQNDEKDIDKLLITKRKLFRELVALLNRLDFLKERGLE